MVKSGYITHTRRVKSQTCTHYKIWKPWHTTT